MYNKDLDIFKAVAETGSFSKAAQKCFITHTAVIKKMGNLETHFGATLFHRSTRGVTLTTEGQILYHHTLEIMDFASKAIAEIEAIQHKKHPILRIGCSFMYPIDPFILLWNRNLSVTANMQFRIIPFSEDESYKKLLNNKFDCIISPYNHFRATDNISILPLGSYHFCLAVPIQHPLHGLSQLSYKDLEGHRLRMMITGISPLNDNIRNHLVTHHPQINIVDIQDHYNMDTFNDCAESGDILLSLDCWQQIHPALLSIPLEESYEMPYGLIYSKESPPNVLSFLEQLKTE